MINQMSPEIELLLELLKIVLGSLASIAAALIVVFIYFQFLQWPNYQANPFEIYFLVLIFLGFIDGVIARLPMTVIVGEKEQIFSFFSVTSTILFWKDTNLFVSCFHAYSFRIFINRKSKWRFTS